MKPLTTCTINKPYCISMQWKASYFYSTTLMVMYGLLCHNENIENHIFAERKIFTTWGKKRNRNIFTWVKKRMWNQNDFKLCTFWAPLALIPLRGVQLDWWHPNWANDNTTHLMGMGYSNFAPLTLTSYKLHG